MRRIDSFLRKSLGAAVILAAAWASTCVSQSASQDSISLGVSLPPDWENSPPTQGSLQGQMFRHKGQPPFEVSLQQNTKNPAASAISLPFECDFVFGVMRSMNQGNLTILRSRPDYFPQEYYARILLPKNQEDAAMFSCLFLGSSSVLLALRPAPTPSQAGTITPLLRAIVDATKAQSTLVYAPGEIPLPRLNVSVAMSHGIWAVGKVMMLGFGESDLLVRTGGSAELKILPLLSKGSCSADLKASGRAQLAPGPNATIKKHSNPPYLSSFWESTALEWVPNYGPGDIMFSVVCRQLTSTDMLFAQIVYGSEAGIPDSENNLVSASLDEIADAISRGPKGDGVLYIPPPAPPPPAPPGVIGGVIGGVIVPNLGSSSTGPGARYIAVGAAIQAAHLVKRVDPIYPPLARQTRVSGTVKLHAIIDKDGSVLELQAISGHPLLIQSAMDAVKQWKYQPTLLNNDPVLVDTQIDVIFLLE